MAGSSGNRKLQVDLVAVLTVSFRWILCPAIFLGREIFYAQYIMIDSKMGGGKNFSYHDLISYVSQSWHMIHAFRTASGGQRISILSFVIYFFCYLSGFSFIHWTQEGEKKTL